MAIAAKKFHIVPYFTAMYTRRNQALTPTIMYVCESLQFDHFQIPCLATLEPSWRAIGKACPRNVAACEATIMQAVSHTVLHICLTE